MYFMDDSLFSGARMGRCLAVEVAAVFSTSLLLKVGGADLQFDVETANPAPTSS
jgi:hypothetical protein